MYFTWIDSPVDEKMYFAFLGSNRPHPSLRQAVWNDSKSTLNPRLCDMKLEPNFGKMQTILRFQNLHEIVLFVLPTVICFLSFNGISISCITKNMW